MVCALITLLLSLSLGPERLVAESKVARPNGYVNLIGAASNGTRALFVWRRIPAGGRGEIRYWSFDGEKPRLLPLAPYQSPIGVVWSGDSFFVIASSQDGSVLLPIRSDGTIDGTRNLSLTADRQSAAASNGNGFVIVNGNRALFFDRAGNATRTIELPPYGGNFSVAANGDDYTVASAQQFSSNETSLLTIRADGTITRSSLPLHIEGGSPVASAHQAVTAGGTLFIAGRRVDAGSPPGHQIALAWDGTAYAVATSRGLRRFSATGDEIDRQDFEYGAPLAVVIAKKKPVVVWWTDAPELHATDDMLLTDIASDQSFPTASNDGTNAFVAWIEHGRIVATAFDTRSLDVPRVKIDVGSTSERTVLSAISVGGTHLLLWRDEQSIRMMRFDARGAKRDAQPMVIGPAPTRSVGDMPALIASGNAVLAVWSDVHDVRALRIPLSGSIASPAPFTIHHDPTRYSFSPHVRQDGVDPVVYWFTESTQRLYDAPAPPYELRSAVIHRSRVRVNPPLASSLRYPSRLVFERNRVLWPEYVVPFYGPWPRPENPTPMVLEFHGAAVATNGTFRTPPHLVSKRTFNWSEQPALDLSIVHAGKHAFAVWTEEQNVMAMPVNAGLEPAGDAMPIGKASTGTLHALETPAGTLFVYTQRREGSEQIIIAPVQ